MPSKYIPKAGKCFQPLLDEAFSPHIKDTLKVYFWQRNILLYTTTLNTQPAFTCSKLTLETLEQGVKYVQSY